MGTKIDWVLASILAAVVVLMSIQTKINIEQRDDLALAQTKVRQLNKALDYCSDGKTRALMESIKKGGRK